MSAQLFLPLSFARPGRVRRPPFTRPFRGWRYHLVVALAFALSGSLLSLSSVSALTPTTYPSAAVAQFVSAELPLATLVTPPAALVSLSAIPENPDPTAAPELRSTPSFSHRMAGHATWYCLPGRSPCTNGYPAAGMYAAIRPSLLGLMGHTIRACVGSKCVAVKIIDCQCGGGSDINLYASVFAQLGSLTMGNLSIVLKW